MSSRTAPRLMTLQRHLGWPQVRSWLVPHLRRQRRKRVWELGSKVVARRRMNQRHGRAGFWDSKASDPLKLKDSSKGAQAGAKEGTDQLCLARGTPSCSSAVQPASGQRGPLFALLRTGSKTQFGPVGTGTTLITLTLSAQAGNMATESSPLTTHVLDTASGLPAQGLCLRLSRLEASCQQWMELRTR